MDFLDKILNPNTRRVYRSLWKNHLLPLLQSNTHDPDRMVSHWISCELKPETIRKLLTLYRLYYKEVKGTDVDLKGLSKRVSKLQIPVIVKAWTKQESEEILKITKIWDKPLYNMLLVTLHTGMRKGEMFGLTWEDIDFLNGRINIRRSWAGSTKTGKPRSVPMSKTVEKVLTECYSVGATGHCFKWCEPNFRLKQMCELANVRTLTWHGLRHTFATLALNAKRSPKEVAEMLGHSKVSTTLDLYWSKTGGDIDLGFLD